VKIAMITGDYLPNIGGIASHIAEISTAIAKLGHSVRVWFWDPQGRPAIALPGVPTELLVSSAHGFRPLALRHSINLARVLREKIAAFEPEILHVHTLAPLSLSMRWLGARSEYRRILTNHSSGYLQLVRTWLGRRKARFYCSAFDGLLAPSRELLEQSRLLGLPADRCKYVPNGIDPDRFVPTDKQQARSRLNLPPERVVLLATRRFAVKNGLRYLARALPIVRKEIPDVLCVFCGDASDAEELQTVERIVAECHLEDCVRFEGSVPNDKISDYLAACDVMVLPSLVEATSISCLEAMSVGKAVVGTRVGGIPELVVHGETGTLVEPANAEDLARGIVSTVRQSDLAALGEAGRRRVREQFTWERIAITTVDFYRKLGRMRPC
jgi:glycosyltransferase involved in cell wall biosynthesis